jgi:hypothetical protein
MLLSASINIVLSRQYAGDCVMLTKFALQVTLDQTNVISGVISFDTTEGSGLGVIVNGFDDFSSVFYVRSNAIGGVSGNSFAVTLVPKDVEENDDFGPVLTFGHWPSDSNNNAARFYYPDDQNVVLVGHYNAVIVS